MSVINPLFTKYKGKLTNRLVFSLKYVREFRQKKECLTVLTWLGGDVRAVVGGAVMAVDAGVVVIRSVGGGWMVAVARGWDTGGALVGISSSSLS